MKPATKVLGVRELYPRLLAYAWPYKWIFALSVIGMLTTAGAETSFVWLLQPIMDNGFVKQDADFIKLIPILIMGIFFFRGIAGFFARYCISWVGRRVVFDIRAQMFARLVRLPATFYNAHSSASLISKLIYDVEQVYAAATNAVIVFVRSTAMVIFLLSLMTFYNWKLTIIFVVAAPIIAALVQIAGRKFRSISRKIQDSVGGIAQVSKEAIQGQSVVKTFGGMDYEVASFRTANNRNRQQAMKRAAISAVNEPFMVFVVGTAFAATFYFATKQTGPDQISAGTFVSYLGAMLMLMGPLKRLAKINELIQTGLAAAQSAFAIMDEPAETDKGTRRLKSTRGHVAYKDVTFTYLDLKKSVLKDLSFEIEPGETVALVGASGSGKSTTMALLLRLYEVGSGEISIDDIPINEIKLKDLRANCSIVTQETILFDDSVRNNITYGLHSSITKKRLYAAAEAAHVAEFVESLPNGYDTQIGEHGVRLSGGQRQRLAIARALFKDAPILLLDEATSSLDAESEHLVQEATERLVQGRTTLVIAHRLSTIERADKILVLRRGRIVESGTHRQLIKNEGAYARLYRSQIQPLNLAS